MIGGYPFARLLGGLGHGGADSLVGRVDVVLADRGGDSGDVELLDELLIGGHQDQFAANTAQIFHLVPEKGHLLICWRKNIITDKFAPEHY